MQIQSGRTKMLMLKQELPIKIEKLKAVAEKE